MKYGLTFGTPDVSRRRSQSTEMRFSNPFGESISVWTINHRTVVRIYGLSIRMQQATPILSPSTILRVKSPRSGVDPEKLTGPSRP